MATISEYQTSSGATLYRVRYRTPDNRQTDKRGFTTKRDAERFANSVEVDKLRGEYVAPSIGRVTVGELGPAWLARQHGHLKAASLAARESSWTTHVEPRWANVRIADMRPSAVSAWIADMSALRGAATVRSAVGVLRGILDDAVADRMLASNPARGVRLPRRPPQRHVYLSADQLDRLADESGGYRGLVLLLGVGGLRWGEAAALRVADVDFLRRRVTLHRNAVTVNGKVVGTLKSDKNRTVALPAFAIDALAETAQGKHRDDLLWTSSSGGYLTPPHGRSWLDGAVRQCQAADGSFPRHGPRFAAHGGFAGDQRRGEPEGGAADAGPCERGHDAGHLRRPVRIRPGCGGRKCGQNVGRTGVVARLFGPKKRPHLRRSRGWGRCCDQAQVIRDCSPTQPNRTDICIWCGGGNTYGDPGPCAR
jgi:integrase